MVAPTAGAVVLVTFPFSDLSQAKLRPAVAIASVGRAPTDRGTSRLCCAQSPLSDRQTGVLSR